MESVAELIGNKLQENGCQVIRAYPGSQAPAITSPVAAVELFELNPKEETATVLVSVLSPAKFGAAGVEDAALEILLKLASLGCTCRQERAKYLSAPELFCVEIYAKLYGTQDQVWMSAVEPLGMSVVIDSKDRNYVKSFEVSRNVSEIDVTLGNVSWSFRLEELFPLEASEPEVPTSAFNMIVRRAGRIETYANCTISGQSRKLTEKGQLQILEGIAPQVKV